MKRPFTQRITLEGLRSSLAKRIKTLRNTKIGDIRGGISAHDRARHAAKLVPDSTKYVNKRLHRIDNANTRRLNKRLS